MESEKFFQSRLFTGIVIGIGVAVVVMIVFWIGVVVGERRANFSFAWAQEYHRNFGGPDRGFFDQVLPANDFITANGVSGKIIKVNPSPLLSESILTIKGSDNVEKAILATSKTTIRMKTGNLVLADLKANQYVVVIGNPNSNGQIQAELIRVMPLLPDAK